MKFFYNFKTFFLPAILMATFLAAVTTASAAPGNDNLANASNVNFNGFTSSPMVNLNNVGATREPGEMVHYNATYPGEKTVWFKWTAPVDLSAQIRVDAEFVPFVTVYKSQVQNPTFQNLTNVIEGVLGFNSDDHKTVARFRAVAGETYYIAAGATSLNASTVEGSFDIVFSVNKLRYSSDFSSHFSETTSMAVYRPSEGIWYSKREYNALTPDYFYFGMSGAATPDKPIPADFDGDARTDLAITRNVGGYKYWWVQNRTDNSQAAVVQWGLATDKALTGDFDRDGRADFVTIRNNGQYLVWYVFQSRQLDYRYFYFGLVGDTPVVGDFDGDGATEVAVTRQVDGELQWHMMKSGFDTNPNATYTEYYGTVHGSGTVTPVAEDFDGDGKTDIGIFQQINGTWKIRLSSNGDLWEAQFGQLLDKPVPADYDGDGKADLAFYRPSEGRWYFWLSQFGTQTSKQWGIASDVPVSSLNALWQ